MTRNFQTPELLATLKLKASSLTPWPFAAKNSQGAWKPYLYLKYISQRISDAIWKARFTGLGGRIIVTMPPRHGKSEFISHWVPTWYVSKFPKNRIIITTYEENFAKYWGGRVRNTIDFIPPPKVGISQDTRAKGEWTTQRGGGMLSAGVGGPITGRGFDLGIIDDPVKNWIEAQSKTVRKNVIDWFNSTFYTRQEPGATMILLMTRWHLNDLAGYLINDHEDDWELINFPAIAEDQDVLGRKVGDALCPERYDTEALARIKKAVGRMVWAGLYQQRPRPAEGQIWKAEYWQWYKVKPFFEYILQSWDTAFKDDPEAAYTACTTWGIGKLGYYLLDVWRDRLQYPDLKTRIISRADKWHPRTILVEDKASGTSVAQDLKRNTRLPIIAVPVNSREGKKVRGQIAASTAEAGLIYLPTRAPWLSDYLDEMGDFPNSENSDQADSTSQTIQWLEEKRGGVIDKVEIFRG